MVRALDCCVKHQWFEPNPRIIVGLLAHCPSSSKWAPAGNTGEVIGGEGRNWPPYLTMPAAQDKCPSNGHSSNVRKPTWDSPLHLPFTLGIIEMLISDLDIKMENARELSLGLKEGKAEKMKEAKKQRTLNDFFK